MQTEIESWSSAVSMVLRNAFVPGRLRRAAAVPPIRVMRALFIVFSMGLLLILLLVWLTVPSGGSYPLGYLILWMAITGIAIPALWVFRRKRNKAIPQLTRNGDAAVQFRISMFVEIALAEGIGMAGFILSMKLGSLLPYLVALPVSLVAMALISPTGASIRRLQAAIDASGGSLRIVDALMGVETESLP